MGNVTWQAALERLQRGNESFCNDRAGGNPIDEARRKELAQGQSPFAIILTCADSRVVPEFAFDTGLGDLFVVRVAGNVPNPSSLASIEYAIAHLGTKLIVVMAHEACGAVAAAIEGGDAGKNLNHLLDFVKPAVNAGAGKDADTVGRINCQHSADALVRDSDIIRAAVENGGVHIVTAFYNLGSGRVDFGL